MEQDELLKCCTRGRQAIQNRKLGNKSKRQAVQNQGTNLKDYMPHNKNRCKDIQIQSCKETM
jgi:hypothetical protein